MTYTFGLGGQVITSLLPPEDRSPTFKDHCDALLADVERIEKLEAKVAKLEAENERLRVKLLWAEACTPFEPRHDMGV